MNSNRSEPLGNINTTYDGLRLTNHKNDCYLNCSLNNLLGVPEIRIAILQSPQSATAEHAVINEIKRLSLSSDQIQNGREVKRLLGTCFPGKLHYFNEN